MPPSLRRRAQPQPPAEDPFSDSDGGLPEEQGFDDDDDDDGDILDDDMHAMDAEEDDDDLEDLEPASKSCVSLHPIRFPIHLSSVHGAGLVLCHCPHRIPSAS